MSLYSRSGAGVLKYRNVKVTRDGVTFDSKREAARYGDLTLLQRAGAIKDLRVHPMYPLEVAGVRVGKLVPDFDYVEANRLVVEDVKSVPTMTPVWRLKWKIAQALRPDIEWRVVR